jgi:hypothetical protein
MVDNQKKFAAIVFSSEDSMGSDCSFLSSDEEEIYNNKTSLYKLNY